VLLLLAQISCGGSGATLDSTAATPGSGAFRTDDNAAAAPAVGSAVEALVHADEAFSRAAARTDLVSGISAMFAPDIAYPLPAARFSKSAAEAIAALRNVPNAAASHASWSVAHAGISGDGQHGFTMGYMNVTGPDGKQSPFKYLAYWIKRPEGWRVAVYRRRPSAAITAFQPVYAPLPARIIRPTTDAESINRFRETLDNAERSFSLDAQRIGLKAAFTKWGTATSWNMGAPTDSEFVQGSEKIGTAVGDGEPPEGSSVYWAPDRVIVASSGDLGVTIGTIHLNKPAADGSQDAGFGFFTIWRRADTTQPWRYIAE
jgi:ketosteroid isomerase-like protein